MCCFSCLYLDGHPLLMYQRRLYQDVSHSWGRTKFAFFSTSKPTDFSSIDRNSERPQAAPISALNVDRANRVRSFHPWFRRVGSLKLGIPTVCLFEIWLGLPEVHSLLPCST